MKEFDAPPLVKLPNFVEAERWLTDKSNEGNPHAKDIRLIMDTLRERVQNSYAEGALDQSRRDQARRPAAEAFGLNNWTLNMPEELNANTQALVFTFAYALAEKLYKSQKKYGYSDEWKRDDWEEECITEMYNHIGKGDPKDVAIYCAFLWHHGWETNRLNGGQMFKQPGASAGATGVETLTDYELSDILVAVINAQSFSTARGKADYTNLEKKLRRLLAQPAALASGDAHAEGLEVVKALLSDYFNSGGPIEDDSYLDGVATVFANAFAAPSPLVGTPPSEAGGGAEDWKAKYEAAWTEARERIDLERDNANLYKGQRDEARQQLQKAEADDTRRLIEQTYNWMTGRRIPENLDATRVVANLFDWLQQQPAANMDRELIENGWAITSGNPTVTISVPKPAASGDEGGS